MKRTKIIYGMGISLIIISIVGIIFYYMNFTRKLVCTRTGAYYTEEEQTDTITFSFKLDGTIKKGIVEQVFDFEKEETAKIYYNSITNQDGYKKELKNKKVVITFEKVLALNEKEYKRNDIKKQYKELDYACK